MNNLINEFSDIDILQGKIQEIKPFRIFFMKNTYYMMNRMESWTICYELEGRKT